MIRYVSRVFPNVEQPKQDTIPRYAVVYLLLKNIPDIVTAQKAKLAVVWDLIWWNGEGMEGVEVFAGMVSKMQTSYTVASLMDFLLQTCERYLPSRSAVMKTNVANAIGKLVHEGTFSLDKMAEMGVQPGVQEIVGRLFPGLFTPPMVEAAYVSSPIVWDFESKEGVIEAINRYIEEDFGTGNEESAEFDLLAALIHSEEGNARARMFLKEMYTISRATRDKPTKKRIGDMISRVSALGSGIDYRVLDYALDVDTSRNEIKWARYLLENHIKPDMGVLCEGCLERNMSDDLDEFYRVVIRACRVFPGACTGNIKVLKLVFGMCDPTSVSLVYILTP